MHIHSAQLIYFSPTNTTKKIIEAIVEGLRISRVERIDLTHPAQCTVEIRGELAIIGGPVYGGRLPVDMISRFQRLKGKGTMAIIVVVYGNRAYEDALLELRDLVLEVGFQPIAAGAFIGEHSYSTKSAPIAAGRPDREDLNMAKEFGKIVRGKIEDMQARYQMAPLQVPGNFPYKERVLISNISPATEETLCTKCGQCASVCPSAAITISDTVVTDPSLCIRCCACIKACSTAARTMEDERMRKVAETLSLNCHQRKEPEIYI